MMDNLQYFQRMDERVTHESRRRKKRKRKEQFNTGNHGGDGSGNSQSSLFTELIDGISVSMIKRTRTKDAVELYVVDLKLTDIGFAGVEDTDYEMIYSIEV